MAPRFLTRPPSASSSGVEAVELAADAGLILDPWQQLVLEVGLAERADGKWAASEVGLVVARQNGKSAIFEALILAGLFLLGERTVVYTAHEFKTAGETFLRVRNLIEGSADLSRSVRQVHLSKGAEGIDLTNGQRLKVIARSAGSGRGFSTDRLLVDEAYKLPQVALGALLPTMSARPDPQAWFGSSAPLPGPDSDALRRMATRGRAGAPDLAYLEWSAASPDDEDAIAQANPSLGIEPHGVKLRAVQSARGVLDAETFEREHLTIFPLEDQAHAVIPMADWRACFSATTGFARGEATRVVIALDMPPDRRHVSFAAVGESGVGGLHCELVGQKPLAEAVDAARRLQQQWGCGPIAIAQNAPAWSMEADLLAAGVELRPVSTVEFAQASNALLDAVRAREIHHVDDAVLNASVGAAVAKPWGDGSWSLTRLKSSADISPLVAVTLAEWVFTADPIVDKPTPFLMSLGGRK